MGQTKATHIRKISAINAIAVSFQTALGKVEIVASGGRWAEAETIRPNLVKLAPEIQNYASTHAYVNNIKLNQNKSAVIKS